MVKYRHHKATMDETPKWAELFTKCTWKHKQHKNDLQTITSDRHNANGASINVTDNHIITNWMVIEEMLWKMPWLGTCWGAVANGSTTIITNLVNLFNWWLLHFGMTRAKCPHFSFFALQQMKTLLMRFRQCRALDYNVVIMMVILREKTPVSLADT